MCHHAILISETARHWERRQVDDYSPILWTLEYDLWKGCHASAIMRLAVVQMASYGLLHWHCRDDVDYTELRGHVLVFDWIECLCWISFPGREDIECR